MKNKQPIMLIGGMGPQASVNVYQQLILKAVSRHGAIHNEDYPHIVIQSLSVPDFISERNRKKEAFETIRNAAILAAKFNPSIVGISCNTAHIYAQEALEGLNLPFASLIDIVSDAVTSRGLSKVGILATPTTINSGLYKHALAKRSVACVEPETEGQVIIENVIRAVIDGSANTKDVSHLEKIAKNLTNKGAEGIILGCTELPLIFPANSIDVHIFDCTDLLTDALLDSYYSKIQQISTARQ